MKQGEAAAPAESAGCVNGDRDDWCAGRDTSLVRRCHRSVGGSTAKKCCLGEGVSTARDEEGSRERRYACQCVMTYEGEITSLAGQVSITEACFPY